ncbi:hypothetical protein BC829DRAFT_417785 [Chytridium lagenaria]|nr:hypothetical protein BC829DRAFT_417785 [Chytridium lagenaria]
MQTVNQLRAEQEYRLWNSVYDLDNFRNKDSKRLTIHQVDVKQDKDYFDFTMSTNSYKALWMFVYRKRPASGNETNLTSRDSSVEAKASCLDQKRTYAAIDAGITDIFTYIIQMPADSEHATTQAFKHVQEVEAASKHINKSLQDVKDHMWESETTKHVAMSKARLQELNAMPHSIRLEATESDASLSKSRLQALNHTMTKAKQLEELEVYIDKLVKMDGEVDRHIIADFGVSGSVERSHQVADFHSLNFWDLFFNDLQEDAEDAFAADKDKEYGTAAMLSMAGALDALNISGPSHASQHHLVDPLKTRKRERDSDDSDEEAQDSKRDGHRGHFLECVSSIITVKRFCVTL